MNNEVYAAALAEYLDRATDDPEWKDLFRRSADKVLEQQAAEERARLLEYMGRFSVASAAFVVKDMAAVYALALHSGREDRAEEHLGRFRSSYILPPAGEEEGKRAEDAPREVFAAALRRRQGTDPVHRGRVENSVRATMEVFAERERREVEALFAGWPVAAVEFSFRIWLWLSDDYPRTDLAGAQCRQWKKTGDERIWWKYFDVVT